MYLLAWSNVIGILVNSMWIVLLSTVSILVQIALVDIHIIIYILLCSICFFKVCIMCLHLSHSRLLNVKYMWVIFSLLTPTFLITLTTTPCW